MPTNQEVVNNRPLGGHELRQILIKDFEAMLGSDGMFAAHIAYKRVAYEISIKLKVDNPLHPEHKNTRQSKNPAKNAPVEQKSVVAPPLTGAENPGYAGMKLEREIDSPNQARIENNLPITVTSRNKDTGERRDSQVQYDPNSVPPGPVETKDTSEDVFTEWGSLEEKEAARRQQASGPMDKAGGPNAKV